MGRRIPCNGKTAPEKHEYYKHETFTMPGAKELSLTEHPAILYHAESIYTRPLDSCGMTRKEYRGATILNVPS